MAADGATAAGRACATVRVAQIHPDLFRHRC